MCTVLTGGTNISTLCVYIRTLLTVGTCTYVYIYVHTMNGLTVYCICLPADSKFETYFCYLDSVCSFSGRLPVQAESGERCCRDEVGFVAYSSFGIGCSHNCSELQNIHAGLIKDFDPNW